MFENGDKISFKHAAAPNGALTGVVTQSAVRYGRITVMTEGVFYRPLVENCKVINSESSKG